MLAGEVTADGRGGKWEGSTRCVKMGARGWGMSQSGSIEGPFTQARRAASMLVNALYNEPLKPRTMGPASPLYKMSG